MNIVTDIPYKVTSKLHSRQVDVIQECLKLGSGGLWCVMGYGKTRISLALSHIYSEKNDGVSVVVCSKSLIGTWIQELDDVYPWMKYEVFYSGFCKLDTWIPKSETKLVITTPGILVSTYTKRGLSSVCTEYYTPVFSTPMKYYLPPKKPVIENGIGREWLFSQRLSCLIVDEVQTYTNIETKSCQALLCLVSEHTWLLSGTIIEEPVPKRMLGYFCLLDIPETPRCMVDTKNYLRSGKRLDLEIKTDWLGRKINTFRGLEHTMVIRKVNKMFKPPRVNDYVVTNSLSEEENALYYMLNDTFKKLYVINRELLSKGDNEAAVEIRGCMLAMITYIRMSIVTPLQCLKNIYNKRDDGKIFNMIKKGVRAFELEEWMKSKNENSTRVKKIGEEVDKYKDDRVVIFTSFRASLNAAKSYLERRGDREIMTITSNMNVKKRIDVVNEFSKTENGVLMLTYTVGANGLNLQCSNTVLLAGLWWNKGKSDQAKARINRPGQKSKVINIVYFTSKTMIEQALLEKHYSKNTVISELMKGKATTRVSTFSFKDVFELVDMKDNKALFENIYINRFKKRYSEYCRRKNQSGWEKEREKYRSKQNSNSNRTNQSNSNSNRTNQSNSNRSNQSNSNSNRTKSSENISPEQLLSKHNIHTVKDWRQWLLKNHPDKNENCDIELVQLINMAANIVFRN